MKFRGIAQFVSVDDKAIINVGEPNCAVSTGVKGHNRSLVSTESPRLLALDHDFHIHGRVASVALFVETPVHSSDSFYTDQPFVTNKDKVTQPSSAFRHATELADLIRIHYSTDTRTASKPVLVVLSDGGPDHRVTFGSVKIASLCLFQALDLDMLICMWTCPYQSW